VAGKTTAHKKPPQVIPTGSLPEYVEEEEPRGTSYSQFTCKNGN